MHGNALYNELIRVVINGNIYVANKYSQVSFFSKSK